ncbi:hypothetical protein BKA69DRAFT_537285 [Paraphysoderma sedebokerense]|nr:hypothetical protein BKA69DRAFT_537285 [Paraphysoderma sedebokerense]
MKSVQTLTKYRNDCAKLKAYADTAGRGFKHIVDDYRSQILLRQSLSNDIISSANAATSSTAISLWLSKYPSGSSFFRILDTWIHLTDNQRLQTEFFCRLESFKALMNSVTVQNPKDIHKLKTQLSSLLSSLRATQFSDQPCIHTNPVPQDSNPIASYQQSIDSHPHSSCQSTSEIVTLRKRAIKNSRNKPVKVQIDEMLKLMDRVDGYKRLVNGADGTRGIVDNGSRTWVLQTLRPIINCYRNCCNSDIECFRRYNGESIKFAKFKHCALRASSESIVS